MLRATQGLVQKPAPDVAPRPRAQTCPSTEYGESVAGRTVVLEMAGVQWASQAQAVQVCLRRLPGVLAADPNAAAQTVTVTFDPAVTEPSVLARAIGSCGYECRGESVPSHVQDTAATPSPHAEHTAHTEQSSPGGGHDAAKTTQGKGLSSPADAMGHGSYGAMSMASMVRDMRNRFVVAAVFGVLITLWSRIGRDVLGFTVPAPFGLRDDVFQPGSAPRRGPQPETRTRPFGTYIGLSTCENAE